MPDFASLLQFLRVYPYCDREVLAADILNVWRSQDENLALVRLKRLFRYISIRRLKMILDLPKRRDFVRYLSFNNDESAAYMALESPIAMMLDEELQGAYNGPSRYVKALAKINMLRRFCNLGLCLQEQLGPPNGYISPRSSSMTNSKDLLDDMLDSGLSTCSICDSEINNAMQESFAETSAYWAQYSTLICYTCYIQTKVELKPPTQFTHRDCHIHRKPILATQLPSISSTRSTSPAHMSTKIRALQEDLIQHKDEKCLNITAASHVYLMEPQWNPTVESQALARVHRLGQLREVTTTIFIMKDSIESHVMNVQDRKKHLGDLLLSQHQEGAGPDRARLHYLRSLLR
ncbi:hypothetical protein BDW69DRAFT_171358, partial [Aspergillus filifer]